MIACGYCGRLTTNPKYCSKSCANHITGKINGTKQGHRTIYRHICLHCKKVFMADSSLLGHAKAKNRKYCSCVCKGYGVGKIYGKSRGLKSAATNAKNKTGSFHNSKLRAIVASLGGKAIVKKNRENNAGPFFNKELHKLSVIASHMPEARLKVSKANKGKHHSIKTEITKESRKSLILPVKDTSIEIKIQDYLKQLGITFLTHQYPNIEHDYQCDILIPSLNMVIECDGTYWHKYPIGREIDHIRTKELLEKGFKVLRLWEFEIKKLSLEDFEKKLTEIKIEHWSGIV